MIRLLAVCPAFRVPSTYVRWRRLAQENQDIEVTLIGPKDFEDNDWSEKVVRHCELIEEERFKVIPIDMNPIKFMTNGWISWELFLLTRKLKPDFIYLIGSEVDNLVFQMALTRKLYLPRTKIAGFTMRGLDFPFKSLHFRVRWFMATKIFDAIFCHFPNGREIIMNQGKYKKPVYMQTQIGVDGDVYKPNKQKRIEIREKLGIKENEFVFGSVGRMVAEKGIFDIVNALPIELKENWRCIILGDGIEMEKLKERIRIRGLEKNVFLPGYVPMGEEVANYLNAMDCFIHVPHTNIEKSFFDTFPVAVAQAMAIGLPIIGSDSGGVPYQLGKKGLIIPFGNVTALHDAMIYLLENPLIANEIGIKLFERVSESFEIKHLTKCFNVTMREIISNMFDPNHIDQAEFKFDNNF